MKQLFVLLFIPLFFQACNSGSSTTTVTTKDSTMATASKITFPYTAQYSSDFTPGKDSDVLTVLNSYKTWETNDMPGLKATIGDSILYVFPNGFVFKNSADSFMRFATKYRDSLSKVKIDVVAWTSNHSVDKNDDWVNVWYEETDTHKNGKVDSTNFEDANKLKDGKIVTTYSYMQKTKM